jgi:hypothetical protein
VDTNRRRTPRYPFIATAEIVEKSSHASSSTRVSELSLHGCYLDMPHPLPKDAPVIVKIYSEGKFFEASGVVVYSLPAGVGIFFQDIRPQFLSVLKQWLLTAMMSKYGPKK